MEDKLVVVGLNEINFDYIKKYVDQGHLPYFKELLKNSRVIKTSSEDKYQLLEPWIQWVTIQTGKKYDGHKVFRLGDITKRPDLEQIFERIEQKGKTVGAISPFNADNRLKNPSFFVPDPWTDSKADGSWLLKGLSTAVSQSVNDNSHSKLSMSSIFYLSLSLLIYVPFSKIFSHYLKWIRNRKLPGTKAVILDSLLGDTFVYLLKKKKPDFSWLFLNSGAHIQHHYLFNSTVYEGDIVNPEWYCTKSYDPLLMILELYDDFLAKIQKQNKRILILTGLHQQPHNHMTYYWRIKEHEAFMKKIGVNDFTKLLPRMSRDFFIEFDSKEACLKADEILNTFYAKEDGRKMFQVDNRGKSLFVELIYSHDIQKGFSIESKQVGQIDKFEEYVAFVAIKNGEHNATGYVTSNFKLDMEDEIELEEMYNKIIELA